MSDPTDDEVTHDTRSAETSDEQVTAGADRPPTEEEEAAAERAPDLDPEVAENYQGQAKLGADVEGEGQID